MKAAVIRGFGEPPKFEEFPDPIARKNEKIVQVKASVLENFDRMVAAGTHYSSGKMFPAFPAIPGHAGVGISEEGELVGFGLPRAPYGAYAEKTVAGYTIPIPQGIETAIAAAAPSAILTSYFPLKYTAGLQPGETVLINGATGVSGKIAIQVAKMLGAGKIVASGRNPKSLAMLKSLGADNTIDLKDADAGVLAQFKEQGGENGYDVVIDFIWGRPAELLLKSFVPDEAGFAKRRIRYVHIGEKAGSSISLSGEMLRTSGVELYGVGRISDDQLAEAISLVWQWIQDDKFSIDIERVALKDITQAWARNDLEGKRLVIIP